MLLTPHARQAADPDVSQALLGAIRGSSLIVLGYAEVASVMGLR